MDNSTVTNEMIKQIYDSMQQKPLPPINYKDVGGYIDVNQAVVKVNRWDPGNDNTLMRATLKEMIGMRLRLDRGMPSPFDFLECHRRTDDTVLVFIVVGNDSITLEDEWKLFPSDTLITQLMLIREKNSNA